MRWPYDKRADPVHAWGAIAAGIAIAGALYAARALNPHTAKSWWWPTNWMVIPVVVIGVGLILLALPVRRSRRKAAPRRWTSRFDRHYRVWVLAGMRFIDQKGLATVGPFRSELDDVYVDVSLAHRSPHLVNEGLLPDLPTDVTERRALSEFLDHPDPVVLAVIGAPGSGKTTLLRHTARQVCQRRRGQKRHLPILLYLRDHVAKVVADPNVALTALLRINLGELRSAEPDGWFEQRLRDGECVVLLDGLDEVARPEDRTKVALWAEHQIRQYPGNDYVITSRPQGYRAAKIDGADVLQVRAFTIEQVSRFVHGWYLAVERHCTGAAGEDITIRARREADVLLERLDRAPALYDLAVNPLLLTMIANVHRYRGALPGGRAELYAEILQVLFQRQAAKDLPVDLAGDKKEALLRGLAYAMMDRRLSDLPHDEVLAQIRPALPRQVTAEGFLADVGSNGLLVERESGLYCFAHHTFQEFLAAAYIRDKGLADVLADTVDDPWWRETTLLYAARADADPIVAACLKSGTITALALAFDCADQDSAIAEELRERLEDLVAEVSKPTTSQERRRLITGVLLARHLRQLIRTSDGTRLCTRPITASLYQFFREDTHTPAPDSPPSAATGTGPVSGMRASDAAAFVRWVNAVIGGEATYRLPSRAELDDPVAQRLVILPTTNQSRSIWVDLGHAAPELWVPSGTPHPHQIDAETLTAHLDIDMIRATGTLTRLLLMRSAVAIRALSSYSILPDAILQRANEVIRDLVRSYESIPDLPRYRGVAFAYAFARARDLARALDRALYRTPYLDPALDLDRDLDRVLDRVLDRDLYRVLDLARALDRDTARDPAPAPARARELAPDLDLAVDLARVLYLDLGLGLDLDRVLGRDLARVLAHVLARDLYRDRGLDLDRDLYRDRVLVLDRVLDRVLDLDLDLDLDRALDLDLDRALDRALDLDLYRDLDGDPDHALARGCSRVMGSALSRALTKALRERGETLALPVGFAKAFTHVAGIHVAGISGMTRLVSPDTLTQRITDAMQALRATQMPYRHTGSPSWAATVGRHLQETAIPVFNRQEQLTSAHATSIRLEALCLAVEADDLDQSELGEHFRRIAAGVTLIERRANGDDPATETIILASE